MSPAGSPMLRAAVGWLDEHREQFELFRDGPDPSAGRIQAISELAMLCRHLVLCGEADRLDLKPLLAVLEEAHATPLLEYRLRRVNDGFVPYALVVDALRCAGVLDAGAAQETLQNAYERGNLGFVERPVHRILELRRLLDSVGVRNRVPGYDVLARASNLGRPVNPIVLTDYDVYSITHSIFFLTDFGRHPLDQLPVERMQRLAVTLDQLLGMQTHRGNHDLVGELLVSARCLPCPEPDLYASAWHAFAAAQWPSGAVPGPYYDAGSERDAADARTYLFGACYHTTLVAALVGSICAEPS